MYRKANPIRAITPPVRLSTLLNACVCLAMVLTVLEVYVGPELAAQQNDQIQTETISDEVIQGWFSDLESDSYSARRSAAKRIERAGIQVVPLLARQIVSGKPESASRCGRILTEVALASSEADMTRVGRVLNLLANNGHQHLGGVAIQIQRLWKEAQVSKNIEKLEDAGFQIDRYGQQIQNQVIIYRSLNGVQQEESSAATEKTEKPEATKPVHADTASIMEDVHAIIAADDERSLAAFAKEIVANRQPKKTSNPLGNENPFAVRGSFLGEVENGLGESSMFIATIDTNTRLDDDSIAALSLLPNVISLNISRRKIDESTIQYLSKINTLQSVQLEFCDYDLTPIFDWIESSDNLQIDASGHKSFLGVQTQTAAYSGERYQCLIESVVEDTAAAKAELNVGDVIETIDGVKIRNHSQLVLAIGSFEPGQEATLQIRRADKIIEKQVQFLARPADQ